MFGSALNIIDSDRIDSDRIDSVRIDFERIDLSLIQRNECCLDSFDQNCF